MSEQKKQEEAPTQDAFGAPLNGEAPAPVVDDKKDEKPKDGQQPNFDIATHPVVVELNKKVEEYAKNLSEQGKVIRRLKKEGKTEETPEVKLPYPEVKFSKDLTDEERDEMTANEIKLFDEAAKAKKDANDAAIKAAKDAKEDVEEEGDGSDEEVPDHRNPLIAAEVERLSGGDTEKKREIMEAVALTSFAGLKTPEQVAERMKIAMRHIPNYQPPKEQQTARGGAVKTGAGEGDQLDTDKIVRESREGSKGNYSL